MVKSGWIGTRTAALPNGVTVDIERARRLDTGVEFTALIATGICVGTREPTSIRFGPVTLPAFVYHCQTATQPKKHLGRRLSLQEISQ